MSSQLSTSPRQGLRARPSASLTKLLQAGEAELRAVGHEALTVRTVAARAGVSPATAYTYLASKNHLFAELFHDYLRAEAAPGVLEADAVARVQAVTRHMADRLAAAPELAAAATTALLSSDSDVAALRVRIGSVILERFTLALEGPGVEPAARDGLRETLLLAFSGALLQAGMGVMTYTEMGDRLDAVVATILRGNT